jgi:hypothetical protein
LNHEGTSRSFVARILRAIKTVVALKNLSRADTKFARIIVCASVVINAIVHTNNRDMETLPRCCIARIVCTNTAVITVLLGTADTYGILAIVIDRAGVSVSTLGTV